MSFEQSPTMTWGQEAPAPRSRFQEARDALGNPELQEKAQRFGREVGSAALKGALENAGVATIEDDGSMSVRKRGIVKAVLMPKRAARKAAMGAVSGARGEVRDQATGYAQERFTNALSLNTQPAITTAAEYAAASPAWGTVPPPQPGSVWGAPAPVAESWYTPPSPAPEAGSGWGTPPNAAPAAPAYPSPNVQPGQGWGPSVETAPFQPLWQPEPPVPVPVQPFWGPNNPNAPF